MEKEQQTYHVGSFLAIWGGQMISLVGSGLSEFALGVYLYERTHSVLQYALLNLFIFLPQIVIVPLSGVIADRYNRRKIMILSNLGGAIATGLLAVLVWTSLLQVWLVYLISLLFAICNATLFPPYTASIPLMVPKKQLSRANGMVQFATSIARTLSPLLAGVLIVTIQLPGIAVLDGVSFLVALVSLVFVVIPQPASTGKKRQPILHDALIGLRFIGDRPGLVGLLVFFAIANIGAGYSGALFTPLVLSFTGSQALGVVAGAGGLGLLSGSLLMIFWGGPKRRIYGVLGGGILFGVSLSLMGVRPVIWLIGIANFLVSFCLPVVNTANITIWQTKVPPELQGRVLASVRLTAWSTLPLAFLTAGPLADRLFEPMLKANGGALAGNVGLIIGTGPGRGIGLLLILIGLLPILAALIGYAVPHVRNLETETEEAVAEPATAGSAQAG